MDGSKRFPSNAFFSGFETARVFLFDTIFGAAYADELGLRYWLMSGALQKKHIILAMVLFVLQIGLFTISCFGHYLQWAMSLCNSGEVWSPQLIYYRIPMLFSTSFKPFWAGIEIGWAPLKWIWSRLLCERTFAGSRFAEALKNSFSQTSVITPHPWYVFVNYSHALWSDWSYWKS